MPLTAFFRYFGSKMRSARRYPLPRHPTIIEPFAGAAGYACRYFEHKVILVERSPIVAGVWRYLMAASPAELLSIPDVPDGGTIADLPAWVPQEARWLVGFWCAYAGVAPVPGVRPAGRREMAMHTIGLDIGGGGFVWSPLARRRIASQLTRIRHWRIIEGDYTEAPDVAATWFIDPPYQHVPAARYTGNDPGGVDYAALGSWCRERRGQIIVCEQQGADWLPFRPVCSVLSAPRGGRPRPTSHEVVWP